MSDPLPLIKEALKALAGHYTLLDWSVQTGIIRDNLPALIAEVEAARELSRVSDARKS
jgi:hypothetical protein